MSGPTSGRRERGGRVGRGGRVLGLCILLASEAAVAGPSPAAPHRSDTRCDACHTTGSWSQVSFDHARTGFLLNGAHTKAACASCHGADLAKPLGRTCASCHTDAHTGEFGTRCASCHEESNWRPLFDADAHRRTNFPLTGRHALLPCQECHLDRRDRVFTRATIDCVGCHRPAYDRTGGTSIAHAKAGFSTTCRDCHLPWTWTQARFPQHDSCFQISRGKHAGIRCASCHLPSVPAVFTGNCSSNNAACSRCHSPASTDPIHVNVAGYERSKTPDRKCYECHSFIVPGAVHAPRGVRR